MDCFGSAMDDYQGICMRCAYIYDMKMRCTCKPKRDKKPETKMASPEESRIPRCGNDSEFARVEGMASFCLQENTPADIVYHVNG